MCERRLCWAIDRHQAAGRPPATASGCVAPLVNSLPAASAARPTRCAWDDFTGTLRGSALQSPSSGTHPIRNPDGIDGVQKGGSSCDGWRRCAGTERLSPPWRCKAPRQYQAQSRSPTPALCNRSTKQTRRAPRSPSSKLGISYPRQRAALAALENQSRPSLRIARAIV